MELLDILGGAASGGAIGGLLGIIGVWLKGREERETIKLRGEHEIELRKLTLQEVRIEADTKLKLAADDNETRRQVASTEAGAQKEVAGIQLQRASIESDKATYSTGWAGLIKGTLASVAGFALAMVDVLRGTIRPLSLVYLLGIESAIAWSLYQLLLSMNGLALLQPEQVLSLVTQVVATISAAFMMAMAWYFGSRPTTVRGGA